LAVGIIPAAFFNYGNLSSSMMAIFILVLIEKIAGSETLLAK